MNPKFPLVDQGREELSRFHLQTVKVAIRRGQSLLRQQMRKGDYDCFRHIMFYATKE